MNERVRIVYEKLGKHYFLSSFANGIKNDKTSSEIHIIIYMLKTE